MWLRCRGVKNIAGGSTLSYWVVTWSEIKRQSWSEIWDQRIFSSDGYTYYPFLNINSVDFDLPSLIWYGSTKFCDSTHEIIFRLWKGILHASSESFTILPNSPSRKMEYRYMGLGVNIVQPGHKCRHRNRDHSSNLWWQSTSKTTLQYWGIDNRWLCKTCPLTIFSWTPSSPF